MTKERWAFLMDEDCEEPLTPEEVQQGWHFCWEMDGLLRNNREEDWQCNCFETIFNV